MAESTGIPRLLTRMVKLSSQNKARRLKQPTSRTQKCPWCNAKGGVYDKRAHPRNQDCGGTKVATVWR